MTVIRRSFGITLVAFIVLLAANAPAQEKNDVAVLFGRTWVAHQTVPGTNFVGNSLAFGDGIDVEINYARLLKAGDLASFSVEVPVLFDLDEDLNYGMNVVPQDYRSYFVTPSARVTFFRNLPITPWVSLGGGFGHFSASSTLEFGGANPGKTGNTTGVLQFGGGIDVPVWRTFSVRAEIRDFYSGVPQLNVDTGKSHQSNLFAGVGVAWRFGH